MIKPKDTFGYSSERFKRDYIPDISVKDIRFQKMINFIHNNGNRILDVGCGRGIIIKILVNNNDVYGIDASEDLLLIAKDNGLKVKLGDLEKRFDFDDKFFDVIIAGEVIEHILDTDFFLNEIKRVLKPDGILILSTPNVASLGRRFLLLLGKNSYFEASFEFPNKTSGHIRFFTKDLLCDFLEYKGFKILEFVSDRINFTSSGKFSSSLLANLFPTLGQSLIVKAKLTK